MQKDEQDYFRSKHFLELLKTYEDSANSGHPVYMDADDLADIADYYQFNGRQDDAEEAVRLAETYNDQAVGPLLYRAREALVRKDFDAARSYADRIKVADAVEGHFMEGEILVCEGKTEEADELFRQYLKDEVPDDEAMDYIYDVANIFSEYNVFDKALEWMFRSKGDDSDDFKELMARTLFGLGKYKDSERIFSELLDHNPYSNRYWNALASAQFMQEDYNSAITSSEYAIAIDPKDPDGLLSKANSLFNLENYEAALSYFEKYSKEMPDDEFGHLHQGTCLINMGRFEEAIEKLKKAEKKAKEDSSYLPEIYQELAFAYSELQQPETAIKYLDKTDELECDHINMQIIKGHVMLANNKKNEAEKVFKKALVDSDHSPHVMLRIIVSLYDNKYLGSTYNMMKSFLNNIVDEDWKDGYSYMALCCMELKKYDEGLEYLKIACERNPKEAKMVMNSYFPKDMEPKDYYGYLINKLKES